MGLTKLGDGQRHTCFQGFDSGDGFGLAPGSGDGRLTVDTIDIDVGRLGGDGVWEAEFGVREEGTKDIAGFSDDVVGGVSGAVRD